MLNFDIEKLKFDLNGLIPVIIQDYYTKKVLTLAYMNKESLEITIKEGKTCFYSRSRKELWRKGETSGNYQYVESIKYDCDCDSLLIIAKKDGPACHTGSDSCFEKDLYVKVDGKDFSIFQLYAMIKERKNNNKDGSYTSYLFEKGQDKILKKIGEESAEVIIAAKNNDKKELIYEISDLTYHLLVLMIDTGLALEDILDELGKRHVIDHKIKQEKMK